MKRSPKQYNNLICKYIKSFDPLFLLRIARQYYKIFPSSLLPLCLDRLAKKQNVFLKNLSFNKNLSNNEEKIMKFNDLQNRVLKDQFSLQNVKEKRNNEIKEITLKKIGHNRYGSLGALDETQFISCLQRKLFDLDLFIRVIEEAGFNPIKQKECRSLLQKQIQKYKQTNDKKQFVNRKNLQSNQQIHFDVFNHQQNKRTLQRKGFLKGSYKGAVQNGILKGVQSGKPLQLEQFIEKEISKKQYLLKQHNENVFSQRSNYQKRKLTKRSENQKSQKKQKKQKKSLQLTLFFVQNKKNKLKKPKNRLYTKMKQQEQIIQNNSNKQQGLTKFAQLQIKIENRNEKAESVQKQQQQKKLLGPKIARQSQMRRFGIVNPFFVFDQKHSLTQDLPKKLQLNQITNNLISSDEYDSKQSKRILENDYQLQKKSRKSSNKQSNTQKQQQISSLTFIDANQNNMCLLQNKNTQMSFRVAKQKLIQQYFNHFNINAVDKFEKFQATINNNFVKIDGNKCQLESAYLKKLTRQAGFNQSNFFLERIFIKQKNKIFTIKPKFKGLIKESILMQKGLE